MTIRFYNTLTHELDDFQPIEPGKVSMYNCGPTVYDYAHIGNFRAFVFADVLRRFLELAGYDVTQVMNITDVGHMTDDAVADGAGEDKMAKAGQRLLEDKKAGKLPDDVTDLDPGDPYQIAKFYTDAFLADGRALGLKVADEHPTRMPHATDYVAEHMIPMIEKLIDRDHAYVADDGAVYYAVESYPEYGRLSGNTLDHLRGGAGGRVDESNQASKRHPADFLLWKPDASHIMKWDSPWGAGYPGWHIECSAMAKAVHGKDVIDIHTGGEDNIFPHHECEIAQSCGATGQSHFAKFWMHTRFLLVDGEKMSKSKGNFFTIRDLLAKGVSPVVIRFELMKSHYRSNMNFTLKGLEDAGSAVRKIRHFAAKLEAEVGGGGLPEVDRSHPVLAKFIDALSDDLNVAGALGVMFTWMNGHAGDGATTTDAAESLAVLRQMDRVLNVVDPEPEADPITASGNDAGGIDAKALCHEIDAARSAKDYAKADAVRQQLIDAGYEVMVSKDGAVAEKKLA